MRAGRRASLVIFLLVACSSDGNSDPTPSTPIASASAAPSEEAVGWAAMLEFVPDTGQARSQVIVNLNDVARAHHGIEPPSGLDDDADRQHLIAMTSPREGIAVAPAPFAGGEARYETSRWREAFGFAFSDVASDVIAGSLPSTYQVALVRVGADAIEQATATDPRWSEHREVEHDGSVSRYRWGNGACALADSSPERSQGCGGALTVIDDIVLWSGAATFAAEAVAEMEAAASGATPSLADVPAMATLADALTRAGAYSGFLTNDALTLAESGAAARVVGPLPAGQASEAIAELESRVYLPPYSALAIATTGDELILVVQCTDGTEAADCRVGTERVFTEGLRFDGTPWRQMFTDLDVQIDGDVVVASATGEIAQRWFEVVMRSDSLIVTR